MIRICDTHGLKWYDKPQNLGSCGLIYEKTKEYFNLRNIITSRLLRGVTKFIEEYPVSQMPAIEIAAGQSGFPVIDTAEEIGRTKTSKDYALEKMNQVSKGYSQLRETFDDMRNKIDSQIISDIGGMKRFEKDIFAHTFKSKFDYQKYGIEPGVGSALEQLFYLCPNDLVKIITREGDIKIDNQNVAWDGYYPIGLSFHPITEVNQDKKKIEYKGDEILLYRPNDMIKGDIQTLANDVVYLVKPTIERY